MDHSGPFGERRSMAGGSMTKAALVEEVARVADLTKKHSEVIVETVFRSIIEALHRGEKIELRGFGSFRLRRRERRKGRNPKTGDRVDVPSKPCALLQAGQGAQGADQPRVRAGTEPTAGPLHSVAPGDSISRPSVGT